ncbi:hypothetical protein AMTR_s00073p00196070 [Amborella trichopoda]|uniref:Uncharacterized protein n=1 Tax=Amborella trichopoda TaxID=13333 RepID=W1NRL9_AMBTC|nr:hypothetical protein AMTR_s00073p00196070 [Amborella trichopoda]
MVSTADEGAYLREMAHWIEEWRSKATQVIGEEEDDSISLPKYEDKYKAILRDIAPLTDHGEGVMRELRTTYLDEGRSSTDEVASLRVECDSAIEEQVLIVEDFEHLCLNFNRVVVGRDFMRDELKRVWVELERVQSLPSSSFVALINSARDERHELKEDVKGLMDRCGKLSGLLLAAGGNPSLADVNPYVRVPLPSFVWSQSQSRASTQMMRGPRQV